MKQMKFFRSAAWLACGVVSSQLIFSAVALLVSAEMLDGTWLPILLVVASSMCIGYLLTRRASRRAILLLGSCIALYLPAQRGLFWLAAFIQDVHRGGPIPGVSLQAVMAVSSGLSVMSVMLFIAVIITAVGLLIGHHRLAPAGAVTNRSFSS